MRPLWFSKIMRKSFPQRFLLARLSNIPVIGKILNHLIFEGVDIIYLPKDKIVERCNLIFHIRHLEKIQFLL